MANENGDIAARGGGIFLRPLRDDDIDERYLSWFRDPHVTRHLEATNITRDDALEHLHYRENDRLRFLYAICTEDSSLHIGNVKIGDIDYKSMTSDLVTVLGDRNYWGRGLATTAIRLGNDIAFNKLNIRKLHGGMYSDNIASVKAYRKAGWVVEAVLYQHILSESGYCDRIVVSCFNPALYPTLPTFPLPLPFRN
jgi:[ribosomal protein S5]-alanine N-acetyltransferase